MEEKEKTVLREHFKTINNLHQKLNDILGPEETELYKDPYLKLRIPTGYIRPVYDFRSRLSCVQDRIM